MWNREARQFFDWLANRRPEIFVVFKNTIDVVYSAYEASVSSLRMETQELNHMTASDKCAPLDLTRKLTELRSEQVA